MFEDKRILVTGGTGSFGNFVVYRLLELNAKEVRILSRDEKKQYDMRVFYRGQDNLSFVIGDIRDADTADRAMTGIDMVFQAAAMKQVLNCERFPMEAVQTNVQGANNIVNAALRHEVERFVTISTDKAVKPVNVMGMTKAIQERIVLSGNDSLLNTGGTKLTCVRYGNVLRSRGSVVPFFRGQLSKGETITITDLRMTRFLLTLYDAIDLVLYAAINTEGGEIFVRKAPAARIVDMAEVLSEEANLPFEYNIIGALPGEKFDEILVSEEELSRAEDMGDYFKIHPWGADVHFNVLSKEYSSGDQLVGKDEIARLIKRSDEEFERMELVGGEFAKF